MRTKRWIITTLSIIIFIFILIAGITYTVDPLMFYHKPLSNYGYKISNDTFQSLGIAKNFDYNSVLIGSSVTMNYSIDQIDEIFDTKSVRLSFYQAYSLNLKYIQDIIFSSKKDVDNLFYGVDTFSIIASHDTIENTVPGYLYDKNPFNDIKYLLNKDLLFSSLKTIVNMQKKVPNTNINDLLSWREKAKTKTGPDNFGGEDFIERNTMPKEELISKDAYLENTQGVLDNNIIPYIEENPNTTFHMFFNPCYIVYFTGNLNQGRFYAILESEKLFIKTLLEYDNVKIHYFQSDEALLYDVYRYIDITHYDLDTNEYILKAMKDETHLLTKQNYAQEMDKLKEIVENFDIESYYDELQIQIEVRKEQGLRY